MKIFSRKPKPIALEIVRRDESKLRLFEWQQDPRLCGIAAKLLADPNWRLILSVLRNESPSRSVLSIGAAIEDRAVMQARGEGYEMALTYLEAMGTNVTPFVMPEAAFAPYQNTED
jgi:hypothetical protein